jgi:hypothetical protein
MTGIFDTQEDDYLGEISEVWGKNERWKRNRKT